MTIISVAALAMLVLGHLLRAIRQATLFPASARPRTFHLMVGLSVAYVVNVVIPFRIGEAGRALYVAARADQPFGRVCATVIVERLSDLAVVSVLLFAIPMFFGADHSTVPFVASVTMGGTLVVAVLLAHLLRSSRHARAALWGLASLFNDRLRFTLVDMAWSAAQFLTSTLLLRPRYVMLTVLMWGAYLLAYVLLGLSVQLDLASVIVVLLSRPLAPLADAGALASALVLLTTFAALFILSIGLIVDRGGIGRSLRRVVRLGLPPAELPAAMVGTAFARDEDYGAMLRAHFTDGKSTMARFGLHGLDGAVVQRLLPGGSDAITAVVETDGHLAIRKFAFEDAGDKLAEQAGWLHAHQGELPLAEITSERRSGAKFRFDMPYLTTARDLCEMIHVLPVAASRELVGDVVRRVALWHESHAAGQCSDDALAAYINHKVVANARMVLDFARLRLPERYHINGGSFSLEEWNCLLDPVWIAEQLPSRATSAIHGDLTIENIIVCPERAPGWYLIDPNPGNLFDTPLIDWAKLMQSLNLGYEALNRGPAASLRDDAIDVMFARSRAYSDVHEGLVEQLSDRLGADGLREVSFHEIVNYLRLIPYKMRHNPAKAMTFFAAASVLLRRYTAGDDA